MKGHAKGAMKLHSAEIRVLPKQFEVAMSNWHVLYEGRKEKHSNVIHCTGHVEMPTPAS